MTTINRAPYNLLVDDDGSNTVGTVWNKNQIKTVLLDPIDVCLASLDSGITDALDGAFATGISAPTATITGAVSSGSLASTGAITGGSYLALGTTPATTGAIRIPNNQAISARNAGNSADVPLLSLDGSNFAVLGSAGVSSVKITAGSKSWWFDGSGAFYPATDNNTQLGASTVRWSIGYFGTAISVGTNPATTGAIRLANDQGIATRNSGNTADVGLLKLNASNQIEIGPTSGNWPVLMQGSLRLGSNTAAVTGPTAGDLLVSRSATTGAIYFGSASPSSQYIFYDGTNYSFTASLVPNTTGGRTLGNATFRWESLFLYDSIRFGDNPATTGAIRLPNNTGIYARNAANTADLALVVTDASNNALVGNTTSALKLVGGTGGCWIGGGSNALYPQADNTMLFGAPSMRWNVGYFGTALANDGFYEGTEMTAPTAPAANKGRIYFEDNGSGKTRLMCRFATGAAQQIAIEP